MVKIHEGIYVKVLPCLQGRNVEGWNALGGERVLTMSILFIEN